MLCQFINPILPIKMFYFPEMTFVVHFDLLDTNHNSKVNWSTDPSIIPTPFDIYGCKLSLILNVNRKNISEVFTFIRYLFWQF